MNLFSLGGFFGDIWMSICLSLNWLLYNVIEILYRVFSAIANVNLFDKDVFTKFTERMYIVVGIAMLFIFAYNLVLMIINPEDKKSTGQMTKLVKETIISLVLVVLMPTIFNYMAIFQKNILDSQIITKIIVGEGSGSNDDSCDFSKMTSINDIAKTDKDSTPTDTLEKKCKSFNKKTPSVQGAYTLTPTLLNAFLYPVNYSLNQCEEFITSCNKSNLKDCDSDIITEKEDKELCAQFYRNYNMARYTGSVQYLLNRSYFKKLLKDEDQKILNFNYVFSIVGGIVAIILFASYTIMIGVRVAKLGFLELIAPIPVMMRIIPKQKEALFDKWLKELKNTYLDIFIRLIIINFSLYAVSLVPNVIDQLSGGGDDNLAVVLLAKAIVILGILQFAKETPALIKDFFGSSGRFSVKGGFDQWKSAGKTASKPLGMGVGAVGTGAVAASRNFFSKGKWKDLSNKEKVGAFASGLAGLGSGIARGGVAGFKNGVTKSKDTINSTVDKIEAQRDKHKAIHDNGYFNTIKHGVGEKLSDFKDYMKGDIASSEMGSVANNIMSLISGMEGDFSSANIKNIEAGRSEIMKNFNADKDFDFNGKHYHKNENGTWSDGTTNDIMHGKLSKLIVGTFKDRLAEAYGQNTAKAGISQGFDRANDSLMRSLRDSLPQLGEEFTDALFGDGSYLSDTFSVTNMAQLEGKMSELLQTSNKTNEQIQKDRATVYKINDEIKTAAKGIKLSNDQAIKAQNAAKEKNSGKK